MTHKLDLMYEQIAGGLISYEIACACESLEGEGDADTPSCTCHGATLRKNLEHGTAQADLSPLRQSAS